MDEKILEKTLGFKITNINLYKNAFVHRSYLNENHSYKGFSNERLEFLGDAVLQLLTSEFLYLKYTDVQEGILTSYRSSLVKTTSLAAESKRLGYGEFLVMSKGEEMGGGKNSEYILANTFEAVLGAMYLDLGLNNARNFLTKNLFYKIDKIIEEGKYKDAKSKFQEISQAKFGVTPTYKIKKESGPDHNKNFEVGLYLNKKFIATGNGSSKQKAEIDAAANGLLKLEEMSSI